MRVMLASQAAQAKIIVVPVLPAQDPTIRLHLPLFWITSVLVAAEQVCSRRRMLYQRMEVQTLDTIAGRVMNLVFHSIAENGEKNEKESLLPFFASLLCV